MLPNGIGVRGVTGKAGVSGRETSVSVSDRYDETDSFRCLKRKQNFLINYDRGSFMHDSI